MFCHFIEQKAAELILFESICIAAMTLYCISIIPDLVVLDGWESSSSAAECMFTVSLWPLTL